MPGSDALRPDADRIARLLADLRGAEILAELQKLTLRLHSSGRQADRPEQSGDVGIWHAERTDNGVGLRRHEWAMAEKWAWADVAEVPPAGRARRVVLIGESTARGWLYDPVFNPAIALGRQLDKAAPGGYQVVDLAKSGATAEQTAELADQIALLEPDALVMFGGNNWTCFPASPQTGMLDVLAHAMANGGYSEARRAFVSAVILPRTQDLLNRIAKLHANHGTHVIVVVPEFNLRGWALAANLEVPILPSGALARWYELRDAAVRACDAAQWADVAPIAEQMRLLDGGTSPVPGHLLGRAAIALGDGRTARAGLEDARDSIVGIGVANTPRAIREIQQLLAAFAAEHGFPCVDLRQVLAAPDLPELPDERLFHDFCHLSDVGIERAMSAVADALLGLPAGSTRPGSGVEPELRLLVHMLAAVHSAYYGQPAEVIRAQLAAAAACGHPAPAIMTALLDILEGAGPLWTHAAIETLAAAGPASIVLGPMLLSSNRPTELWALGECIGEMLGRAPSAGAEEMDLLCTSDDITEMSRQSADLSPPRYYFHATTERSRLAFNLGGQRAGTLSLTYRMPGASEHSAAEISVNDSAVGTIGAHPGWTGAAIEIPASVTRPGVNWVSIRWPVPATDAEEHFGAAATAMARGEFPCVFPVFGELFDARIALR
jgi:hypothetical protein